MQTLRILKWFLLAAVVLVVGAALVATLYTRTENFQRWVRQEAVAAVNDTIRGTISIERLEGSVWREITLYNTVLSYEGREIARFPRLTISFSLLPLLWGEIRISAIDGAQPQAHLRQDRDGNWNVIEAVLPRQTDTDTESAFAVFIRTLRVKDGAIDLQLASENKIYRFEGLQLESGIHIGPTGVRVGVRELESRLVAPGYPGLNLKGAVDYRQNGALPGTLSVRNFWAVSRDSRVRLNGQIGIGEPINISAQASLEKLGATDIAALVSGWPVKDDLAGVLTAEGTLDALKGNVRLAAAGAKVDGDFQVDVTRDLPIYSATLSLSEFDLRRWLDGKNISGVMNATLQAAGTGFALGDTTGKTRLEIRSAEAQGWSLGMLSMEVMLKSGVAAIEGQIKGNLGGANWSGKIGLSEKRPNYDLAWTVRDLDVQKVVSGGAPLQGKLNFQGSLKGAGINIADTDARAELAVLPSNLGALEFTQGELKAVLRDKKIRIERATLNTRGSALSVSGALGIDTKVAGMLDYRLRVDDLAPWLAWIDRKGVGAVNATGSAQGSLAELRTQGNARLVGVRIDSLALKEANVKFALQRVEGRNLPSGTLSAQFVDLDAGIALKRVDVAARLARETVDSIHFDVNALDQRDRRHALTGAVELGGDAAALRLHQASLGAPDGFWKLAGPATVTRRDQIFFIEHLTLRNGAREVALNGRFALAGAQDLQLSVDRLPLDIVMAFITEPPKMSGLLAVNARLTGTAAAPVIAASAKLSGASFAGQGYAGAVADIGYQNGKATLQATVQQDATHVLNAAGILPLALSWHDGLRADFADGMDVRLQSTGMSLAFLNSFSGKTVENIAGELSLDIAARGSVKQPDLRGNFKLRDGKLKAVPIGVEIQQVVAAGELDSRNLTLREFSAKTKDGEIRGSGSLALKNYDIGAVKLALTARRWPAIETARHQVKIDGDVEIEGAVQAPRVKGQIVVIEGSLRPDLQFLEQSKAPFKRDETIVIVRRHSSSAARPGASAPKQNQPAESEFIKNLQLDLTVRAPGNVWIRHPDLMSELSGNVRVSKTPQREIDLTGRIDIVRGWFAFQGRRFQLESGAIQFTGGDKINPSLNIVAQYRLPEYQVDATIGGTVEKPTLTLASQPRLEQADILALLIFGRPINTLNQNEQGALQQSAVGITSGYVAGRIANSVSDALGLDSLGVDIREVDFSGGRVGFGRYVGTKTYVSVSQQLSGEHGREVQLEYQIAPDWKLGTSTDSTGSNGIDIIWHKRY
jgi:autotransporter translocation and assembly factor TamB